MKRMITMTTVLTLVGLALLTAGNSIAQTEIASTEEKIPSRYDAPTLPAFQIDDDRLEPQHARLRLKNALLALTGQAEEVDLQQVDKNRTLEGTASFDSNITLRAEPKFGRLDIVNHRVRLLAADIGSGASISRSEAVDKAKALIHSLHDNEVIDKDEFDLQNPSIAVHKEGFGGIDQPIDPSRERVVDYRITAKRQINGVPVVGSYVRVVVHATGEVSELNISSRPLKAMVVGMSRVPAGSGANVAIDRTAEEAHELLKKSMNLDPQQRLHIERWGLAYVDAPTDTQRFYQPVYVFLVTPLTETEEGVLAARKLVRMIPASDFQLETVPFDPLEAATASNPAGDRRTLQRKRRR